MVKRKTSSEHRQIPDAWDLCPWYNGKGLGSVWNEPVLVSKLEHFWEGKMKCMNCKEAQGMVPAYLNGTLSFDELEDFLAHVRGCADCYEELEILFLIDRAVPYLDAENASSFNLRELLEEDLKEKERSLIRRRRNRKLFVAWSLVTALMMGLMFLDLFGFVQISRLF